VNTIESSYDFLCENKFLKIAFDEVYSDWKPDIPPITTVMSVLGDAIMLNEMEFTEKEYTDIFDRIERLLINGNDSVKNAIATGLLETLLHSSKTEVASNFTIFIGKRSKEYCIAWDEFTGVKTFGLY
jgi:hypothetical protein